MSYPQLYKDELLKAIESIDLGKVGQAIAILARARDEAPCFLMSRTMFRENLPVLAEIRRRGLPRFFFSDIRGWSCLRKPWSLRIAWDVSPALLRGSPDVLKEAVKCDALYPPDARCVGFPRCGGWLRPPKNCVYCQISRGEPYKVAAVPGRSTEGPDRKAGLTCAPSGCSPSLHENSVAPRGRHRSRTALAAPLRPRPGPRSSPEIHPVLGHFLPLRTNRISWPISFVGQHPHLRRERRWRFRRHRSNTDSALGRRPARCFASTLLPGWHVQRIQHLGPVPRDRCHPRRKRTDRCADQVDRCSRRYDALDKRSLLLET